MKLQSLRAISGALASVALLSACLTAPERPTTRSQQAQARVTSSWRPHLLEPGNANYLPDFSYAGYHEGDAALPEAPATHAIAGFGALPDDGKDDTAAFREALAVLAKWPGPVVLMLGKGRYELSDALFVERSDLVLRGVGSGPDGSVLAFSKPLADLPRQPVIQRLEQYLVSNDKKVKGKPFSPFSWTGGLIWTRLPGKTETAPGVSALSGRRGERSLRLSGNAPALASVVELRWYNRFGSDSPVLQHLFGLSGNIPGERLAEPNQVLTSQAITTLRVTGDSLELKEPLRHDVRPDWGAELAPAPARLSGVGFEHFRIELPNEPYAGHHLERGANGLYLTELRDSFVRDVAIHDADSAILSDDCEFLTLTGVRVSGRAGHYGIHLGDVESILVRDFEITAPLAHSLSFNTGSRGSVFSRGRVVDPKLDQHRGRNHQNLFDAIVGVQSGASSALFEHGGADYWGPTHGAFNTFWNITLRFADPSLVQQPLLLSGVDDAGPARIVGLNANVPLVLHYAGAYQEGVGRADIAVPSLYELQLAERRLHYSTSAQRGSTP